MDKKYIEKSIDTSDVAIFIVHGKPTNIGDGKPTNIGDVQPS